MKKKSWNFGLIFILSHIAVVPYSIWIWVKMRILKINFYLKFSIKKQAIFYGPNHVSSNIKRNNFFTYLHIYFHMTLIQIQSKFCLKKIIFSHRTGKIGAIWMHTGPLEGQNVLEFIDQHLALSSTAILFQENRVFMPYLDSISNWVMHKLHYKR